jgi:hypothetical protein
MSLITPLEATDFSLNATTNPPSNLCFVANTLIQTDQGYVPIQWIQPGFHTIRNKSIVAISKTSSLEKELVFIPKHAIGNFESITLSKTHLVFYNGYKMAYQLPRMYFVPYRGQLLYNVLMEEHDVMIVAGVPCETVHPRHPLATLFRIIEEEKCTEEQEQHMFSRYQQIVKKVFG